MVGGLLECSNWKLLADWSTNSVDLHPFIMIMIMGVKMAQAVDNTPSPEALDAAKAAIGAFFGNADQEELENFGFNNHEEFKNAYIGDGFKVYFLHLGTVLNTIHAS